MIDTIFNTSLFLHVIAGVLSLVFGLVAMLVRKKGGKIHNVSGLIFYWSMAFIFITAILFVILYPTLLKYHFFLTIGIVSFYPTFSGKRVLSMKKGLNVKWYDWLGAFAVLISGVIMIAYGVFLIIKGISAYTTLFFIFGIFSVILGVVDVYTFSGRRNLGKMHWFFGHAAKMIGAYSAAVTAFCVNIVPRFLPDDTSLFVFILTWVGPAVVFGFVSRYYRKKYQVKFKLVK